MKIRIVAPKIPLYLEDGGSGTITGNLGILFTSTHAAFFKNFTFVVGTIQDDSKRNKSTSTGLFDIIERQEADMLFSPLDYGKGPKFLTPTSQVGAVDGVASHAPTLSLQNQDVINVLDIFPWQVLLLLMSSIIASGLTLLILDRRFGLFGSIARVSECLLNQSNLDSKTIRTRIVILFWLMVSFVVTQVYEQSMNADMVLLDFSSIVESLDDLDKHKSYRPVFTEGEFIRTQFKQSSDPVRKRIWNRPNRLDLEFSPMAIAKAGKLNDVQIGMREATLSSTEYFCGNSLEQKNNRKSLIGTKGFGVVNMAFHFRNNVDEKMRLFIEYRALLVAQGGHNDPVFRGFLRMMPALSPKATPACICYSKEELYDDIDTLQPIRVNNIAGLFGLYSVMIGLSSLTYLAEYMRFKMSKKVGIIRVEPF